MTSSSSSSSSSSESEGHHKKFKKHKKEKKEKKEKHKRKDKVKLKHGDPSGLHALEAIQDVLKLEGHKHGHKHGELSGLHSLETIQDVLKLQGHKHGHKHGEPSGLHALDAMQDVLKLEGHKHGHKHGHKQEAAWSGHIPAAAAGVIHQHPHALGLTHNIMSPSHHQERSATSATFSAHVSDRSIPLGSHSGGFSPSGHRVPLKPEDRLPSLHETGPAPFLDADGGPVFIGSALFERSVHPCKIVPNLPQPCRVAYAGEERQHHGRYDLLPFIPGAMEWVTTSGGRVPMGRQPIEGGYEEDGSKLYHAAARIDRVIVPGKTGAHLGGACVAFGNREHYVKDHYEILCWK